MTAAQFAARMVLIAFAVAACRPSVFFATFEARGVTTTLTVDDRVGIVTSIALPGAARRVPGGVVDVLNPGGRLHRLWIAWDGSDCPEWLAIVLSEVAGGYDVTVREGPDRCPTEATAPQAVELHLSRPVSAAEVTTHEIQRAPD